MTGEAISWICGWCGDRVAAKPTSEGGLSKTYLCPRCARYTVVAEDDRVAPPEREFASVLHMPADVATAWGEACLSFGASAFTAAEIMCRKILMHIAVDQAGSKKGKTFKEYIEELDSAGFIQVNLKNRVTEIKDRGNIANHELPASTKDEAKKTMAVTRHLLLGIYELPADD